jgi:hypothetical protein
LPRVIYSIEKKINKKIKALKRYHGATPPFFFKLLFIIFFKKNLIEYMTRGKGIIGIFQQDVPFWHSSVVCGAFL